MLISLILLSLALAADCFAVSIAAGAVIKKVQWRSALKIGLFFGGFQSAMALAGLMAGSFLYETVSGFDHWIALSLLSLVGGKMIYESFELKEEKKQWNPLKNSTLTLLALATSIDALAVGISLAFTEYAFVLAIILIGGVSFALSFLGTYLGEKIGHFFENRIELAGGILLILIGLKILMEHLGIL